MVFVSSGQNFTKDLALMLPVKYYPLGHAVSEKKLIKSFRMKDRQLNEQMDDAL